MRLGESAERGIRTRLGRRGSRETLPKGLGRKKVALVEERVNRDDVKVPESRQPQRDEEIVRNGVMGDRLEPRQEPAGGGVGGGGKKPVRPVGMKFFRVQGCDLGKAARPGGGMTLPSA